MKHPNIELIKGGKHSDERGVLLFNNDFDLTPVKRYYIIQHPDITVVRAWQGHQQEHKYFKCIQGSFVVAWKEIDEFNNPKNDNDAEFIILNASENSVLSIPPGYANGLKALISDSEIMVFSSHKLGHDLDNNIRFDKNLWLNWNQF